MSQDCSCSLKFTKTPKGKYSTPLFIRCPLHESAKELLFACKFALKLLKQFKATNTTHSIFILKDAIAHAEAK